MHRNARVSILTEPLWAMFGTSALFYLTFFMKAQGLSALQIGLIVSCNLYVACVLQLLAGPITDRLGRKRATLLFDLSTWFVPMLLWAISSSFWFFLAGYVLNASSRIAGLAFWLLTTEDSPPVTRPRIFAAVKVIVLCAGFFVPVVGKCISLYGAVPTLRVVFFVGALAMLAQNLIRNAFTTETRAGVAAMRQAQHTSLLRAVWLAIKHLNSAVANPAQRGIVLLYIASALAVQLNIFQAIYLSEKLDFSAGIVGLVPAMGALASLLVFLVIMPRVDRRYSLNTLLLVSAGCTVSGWLLFLFVGPGNVALLCCATPLIAAGTFALESYREALVINSSSDEQRAAFFSGVQSVTAILSIPSGLIAALLFAPNPLYLYGAITLLYACTAAVTLAGRRSMLR